jgi:hypothetical protein
MLYFQKKNMKFALCLLVLVAVVSVVKASYLGYGGIVGDLTPRTGSKFYGVPSTNFRQSFSGFDHRAGSYYSRVRRQESSLGRSREARFSRGFGGNQNWRLNSGSEGRRGSYPRSQF